MTRRRNFNNTREMKSLNIMEEAPVTQSSLSFLQQRQIAHLNGRKEQLEKAENEFH